MNFTKIEELKHWMLENQIDLTYITSPESIAYFSGFTSDPHERILALFIAPNQDPFMFTPALEVEACKQSGWNYDVVGYTDSEHPWKKIVKEIQSRYNQVARFAIEKSGLSLDRFEELAPYFKQSDFSFDVTPVIQKMQLIKTANEVEILLEAGNWADVAFEIGFNAVREGALEQEIAAEIDYQLKRQGIKQMSFDTTVLSGLNAANPHGVPGNNPIKPNELVLFDLGVVWKGYCSDATRTIAYKEPTAFQEKIYNIVLEAQLAAQEAVRPGVTASELDKIARDYITSYGYGEAFNHRLGHGIGTSVHEYPSLVEGNDLVLEEGMCFSIEPGIYLPNEVGVRIEDCVYVTKDGCQPFTKTPKTLQIL